MSSAFAAVASNAESAALALRIDGGLTPSFYNSVNQSDTSRDVTSRKR
jgi:hypothetical protein